MAVINISKCPHCGKVIDAKVSGTYHWVDEEIKNPTIFRCQKCGGLISTGETEWETKTDQEKNDFIFKRVVTTLVTAFGLGLMLAGLTGYFIKNNTNTELGNSAFWGLYAFYASLIIALNIIFTKKEISSSKERTKNT